MIPAMSVDKVRNGTGIASISEENFELLCRYCYMLWRAEWRVDAEVVDEEASLVSGVGEGEGAERIGDCDEDAEDDHRGFLFGLGEFGSRDGDEGEEDCDGDEEVSCGLGEFFVFVDRVFDCFGAVFDDVFGGFSGEDGGEGEGGAEDEHGEGGLDPGAASFFVDEAEEHWDPCDHEESEREVDDDGVHAFEGGDRRE
tara:strand:+ start:274 stop:867 length:594 start_codon:yes stop_codon:yes gene_type:complete